MRLSIRNLLLLRSIILIDNKHFNCTILKRVHANFLRRVFEGVFNEILINLLLMMK